MRIPKAIPTAAVCAVLALGSVAAPAAAASPRLAFVNGIPGRSVDVCIGNSEVKSALRYGRWSQTTVSPGTRTVRFRAASPGRCNGTILARRSYDLVADADVTVVATARSPKVVTFNNLQAPAPVGTINWMAARQASDIGTVILSITAGSILVPAAPPVPFEKGDQWRTSFGAGASLPLTFAAYRPSKLEPFAGPNQYLTYEGRRHEIILVGSRTSNARFVAIVRPTITP
jgi:hypothetical protein